MKNLIIISLLFCGYTTTAQSIERQVIGSTGGTATAGNVIVTSTVGEVAVATASTSSILLTQGYQQAADSSLVSISEIEDIANMKLYPNPTTNSAKLEITANFNSVAMVTVYASDGKLIRSNSLSLTSRVESTTQIDLSNQASGVYLIRITGKNNSFVKTMRLVKQ